MFTSGVTLANQEYHQAPALITSKGQPAALKHSEKVGRNIHDKRALLPDYNAAGHYALTSL